MKDNMNRKLNVLIVLLILDVLLFFITLGTWLNNGNLVVITQRNETCYKFYFNTTYSNACTPINITDCWKCSGQICRNTCATINYTFNLTEYGEEWSKVHNFPFPKCNYPKECGRGYNPNLTCEYLIMCNVTFNLTDSSIPKLYDSTGNLIG